MSDKRRDYEADVFYEVWRSGGDPDRIDYDRLADNYWNGIDAETATHYELRAQRPKPRIEEEFYKDEPEEVTG
jgi:hypothetical protein